MLTLLRKLNKKILLLDTNSTILPVIFGCHSYAIVIRNRTPILYTSSTDPNNEDPYSLY